MRSQERERSPGRSPKREADRADRMAAGDGRRGGGETDLRMRLATRPQPSRSGPWELARGQRGAGEGHHEDADETGSLMLAKEADGEETAEDDPKDAGADRSPDDMHEGGERRRGEQREERGKATGSSRSTDEVRGSSAGRRGSADADRAAGEMRGNGSRCRESADAAGSTGEMRGNDARRRGSADADGSAGEMPENDVRRHGSAVAAGSSGEMSGNGARRHGSTDAGGSAGKMPENDARRRRGADADRSPARLRRSDARHGEGKEAKRAPETSREEERRRDVQAGVYGSPEPRRGHERRRRMALGGWRSPEQGGEESEDDRDRRRAQRSPARQRTEEREARVKGSECSSQYATGAGVRARREEIKEFPCAGAGLVQEPVGEARGRQERKINRRKGEEERCRREVSPGKDPGSDKGRRREDHGRRGAGGRGRRCEGESLGRKEGREKTRRSDEELREEKEHEYSEEEDHGYNLERRRCGKQERCEKEPSREGKEEYTGGQEGRREYNVEMREKQDDKVQNRRGEKQSRRREMMPANDSENEEGERDRPARHGSGRREGRWEEYYPEKRERSGWGSKRYGEAQESEGGRSPSPTWQRRQQQSWAGAGGARAAREGIYQVLYGTASRSRESRERREESSRRSEISGSWETGRWNVQAPPQVEVPVRFTGGAGSGTNLKNYLMQIANVKYRCDRSGMDPIEFFLSLPNTLGGEAETLYRMKMPEWLRRAEEDGDDPTTLFLERLRKQFPGHTADRIRDFQEFRR
ncbi:unnamed protein product, partial [Closterium sp. NIES-53]